MWPFKKLALLDEETARWHVDAACWSLRKFREIGLTHVPRLILPAKGFYVFDQITGQELAVAIAEQTKMLAGLDDWPFAIVNILKDDPRIAPHDMPYASNALTSWDSTEMLYVESCQPVSWIAMVIRALATQVVLKMLEGKECDSEEAGARRDLTACMLGFGVFLNDVALRGEWHSGYRARYAPAADPELTVSVAELVFDLALFLTAHDIPADDALPFLTTPLTDTLKSAMGDMDKYRGQLRAARIGF